MSDIILNARYAPGIPTYGVPGEDGEKGDNGRSIFYVPIDITNNESELLKYINANKIYNTNIPYVYSNGDAFVQSDGKIYQYNKNNDVKFEYIDNFNFGVKDIFEKDLSDNFIYNKDQKNIFLTDSSNITNSNYLFNIESEDNKFIKLQNGDKSITITFDEDLKGFLFSSEEPIFFDNLYAKNPNNTNEEYDVSPASEDVEEDIIIPGNNYIYYEEVVGVEALGIGDLTVPSYLNKDDISFGSTEEGNYKYINFTNEITEVPNEFFKECKKIKKIILPNSIKNIGQAAFGNCSKLEFINIPDGLTDIGQAAFLGCISLKSIDMPNSVSFLGNSAFHGCSKLENVNISNKITEIPWWCFYNCSSLKEIILPSSVDRLREKSLSYAGEKNIHIKNIEKVLVCEDDTFYDDQINVYVYANIYEEYKNDDFWSKYNISKIDYVDEDIFEEVNNYQPVINYFDVDISNDWKENDYVNTKIENYINDYVFEASYKSKKTIIDGEVSYNSFIEGIKGEIAAEDKINLIITSKKYFVSKYKGITLTTNN